MLFLDQWWLHPAFTNGSLLFCPFLFYSFPLTSLWHSGELWCALAVMCAGCILVFFVCLFFSLYQHLHADAFITVKSHISLNSGSSKIIVYWFRCVSTVSVFDIENALFSVTAGTTFYKILSPCALLMWTACDICGYVFFSNVIKHKSYRLGPHDNRKKN